ncbi:gamma-glutamylcyclotransferase [Candidatus Poribacteria bacterium]|nr:gamma-glutamylcyclotransferase [Candidatus Poribacteria bacterium]
MRYFAYGSNLNKKHMMWRCKNAKDLGVYTLEGYQLTFRYYADIIPMEGQSVIGGLWEITTDDEVSLDKYEGYPELYRKHTQDGIMFYYMRDDTRGLELPAHGYLEGMLEGMEHFDLPPIETLNHNLGNPPMDNKAFIGDQVETSIRLIADSLGLTL